VADTVVVVGAGLAGLSAAWELQRLGLRVALLERQTRPGGRALSARLKGFVVEPLSPLLPMRDGGLSAWMAELGVADALLPLRPVVTAQVHGSRVAEVDARGLLGVARIRGVLAHQALRLVRLPRLMHRYGECLSPEQPERGADLDDRSIADFARLYFGESVLARVLEPFVGAASLADAAEASRVLLLRRWSSQFGVRPGLPRAPLTELCEAAAERLPLLAGAEVQGLWPRSEAIDVTYTREGRERLIEGRAVVLALPAPEAAALAGPLLCRGEHDVLGSVGYAPAVSLALAVVRPPSGHPREIRVPRAEGSPLVSVLQEPGLPGGRVPDGYGSVTLRATATFGERALTLPDDAVEKELLDAFERFEPQARGRVEFARVLRLERGWPRFDVGHYRQLATLASVEASRLAEGGRLVLAGDYRMDPSWEGALASGRRAARSVAHGIGLLSGKA
jgi:oxygen-dependent protoporphyrinogen oxidase